MTQVVAEIVTEQQCLNNELQAQLQASQTMRIYCHPIHRHAVPIRRDLARASVSTGDLLSRTWHDRLLGAAAGAAVTLATLWLIIVSTTMATIILCT